MGRIERERYAKIVAANAETLDNVRLYTLTELEPVLGVSHATLVRYVKTGRLKAVKLGQWKVSEENLQKFINGES